MKTIELFTWQTLYKHNHKKMWRSDPNHYYSLKECYDAGIDIFSVLSNKDELSYRIVKVCLKENTFTPLSIIPYYNFIKETQNAL